LAATPVAVWWLVGDLSAAVPAGTALDHLIRPPAVDPGAERVIGIASVVLAGLTLALLAWASRRHRFDRRWWAALLPALAGVAIAGLGWRVATAGTIGPNIGAGLMIFIGGPVVGVLLLWAVGWSVRLLLSSRRSTH
jgi:hypothetical protein